MKRILVIRGGAIGDFILTLPTLRALRAAYPAAHLEVLGYKHIAVLAENPLHAQRVRSIEYAPLARFFARGAELPADLADYFAEFDLILNYLYDPDGIFEMNLRRCGVENLLRGPAKIDNAQHAAAQLARPLEELEIDLIDFTPRVFPSTEDREFARDFLHELPQPIVALHPGSGSSTKNWPLRHWIELGNALVGSDEFHGSLLIISEADEAQTAQLESIWKIPRVRFAKNLPLPHLAAVLEPTIFLGHDSGISHLAAAAGARCILLFGPTEPEIWAPRNENVCVIRAPNGDLGRLSADVVTETLAALIDTCLQTGVTAGRKR